MNRKIGKGREYAVKLQGRVVGNKIRFQVKYF